MIDLEAIHDSDKPVQLVWVTPEAEKIIGFCAKVSNPSNQLGDSTKLLKYCIAKSHWSIFEQAAMCVQIVTGRDISAQILRHRSFSFQEFSQRYAQVLSYQKREAREQDEANRQNSTDSLSVRTQEWWNNVQQMSWDAVLAYYEEALDRDIAKECARSILPMASTTKLYMTGTIRSFIHYLAVRTADGVQKEHKDIALGIKEIFKQELPTISSALGY